MELLKLRITASESELWIFTDGHLSSAILM